MTDALLDAQRGAAQRPSGQGRDARLTPPRRSAARLPQGCSRCAGGGKPRVLPRAIGGHSWSVVEPRRDRACKRVVDAPSLASDSQKSRGAEIRTTAICTAHAAVAASGCFHFCHGARRADPCACLAHVLPSIRREHLESPGREIDSVRFASHFEILGFGPHRAAHNRIIVHDAPFNKEVIFIGGGYGAYGAKPSNLRGELTRAALCARSARPPG